MTIRRTKHWRTNVIAAISVTLFIAALVAVFLGIATLTEAGTFLSIVAMPLLMLGFRFSADSKVVEENKYPS